MTQSRDMHPPIEGPIRPRSSPQALGSRHRVERPGQNKEERYKGTLGRIVTRRKSRDMLQRQGLAQSLASRHFRKA